MSRALLTATFIVVFAAGLIVLAPLRAALAVAAVERIGFSAERVTGSAWNGVAERAQLGRLALGSVRMRLDPASLLTGAPRVRFSADGQAQGAGALVVGPAQRGVSGLTAVAPVAALSPDLPLQGTIAFADVEALMGPTGCVAASGAVSTDVLQRSGAALMWQGPVLAGEARCAEDGAIEAAMTGAEGAVSAAITLKVFPDGRYTLHTRIAGLAAGLSTALQGAGFAPGQDGYARLDTGFLSDAASR